MVERRSGPEASLFIAGAVQQTHHLEEDDAAGTGGWGRDDDVVPVLAGEGRPLDSGVVPEIFQGDEASVFLHLGGEESGGFSFIELFGTAFGDS